MSITYSYSQLFINKLIVVLAASSHQPGLQARTNLGCKLAPTILFIPLLPILLFVNINTIAKK